MIILLALSAIAANSEVIELPYNGVPGVWMDEETFQHVVMLQESLIACDQAYTVLYNTHGQLNQDFDKVLIMAQEQAARAEELYKSEQKALAWTGRMVGISIGSVIAGILIAILF